MRDVSDEKCPACGSSIEPEDVDALDLTAMQGVLLKDKNGKEIFWWASTEGFGTSIMSMDNDLFIQIHTMDGFQIQQRFVDYLADRPYTLTTMSLFGEKRELILK